ncbi:MAG: hypothetical protein IJ191_08900 [Treponema sp.]|nr:hypothetical protein [Treponema sp.]
MNRKIFLISISLINLLGCSIKEIQGSGNPDIGKYIAVSSQITSEKYEGLCIIEIRLNPLQKEVKSKEHAAGELNEQRIELLFHYLQFKK